MIFNVNALQPPPCGTVAPRAYLSCFTEALLSFMLNSNSVEVSFVPYVFGYEKRCAMRGKSILCSASPLLSGATSWMMKPLRLPAAKGTAQEDRWEIRPAERPWQEGTGCQVIWQAWYIWLFLQTRATVTLFFISETEWHFHWIENRWWNGKCCLPYRRSRRI